MKTTVIIPVYNEAEIIEPNTAKLVDYLNETNLPFEVIISRSSMPTC